MRPVLAKQFRRGPGRALGAAVIGLLALTACTPPGLPEPITPTGPTSVASSPPAAGTVVIGLDGSAGRINGFNPYAIADFSPTAQAAASLVLPSTFVVAADGSIGPDPDVIDAATVTSQNPFTVTYTVDRKASWTDGTPITAEDFSYLRDQLQVQPGTVGPAGYQLITAIRSRDAGKTVEVEFSSPFPDWTTLFSPLLPSHLMKDFPGGWSAALDADLPLAANRYRMTSYDPVTGQVTLARNDKYWGTPPTPTAVILRLGDPTDLVAAFARGDVQALWFAPDEALAQTLDEAVPAERRAIVPTPTTVQLVFNTVAGPTAAQGLRTAIAAGLDRDAIAQDLTGGWSAGGAAVTSQVLLPSEQPDSDTSVPPSPSSGPTTGAVDALAAAGYRRDGLYASRDGAVLRLTLGYPSGNPRLAAAARTIQRQLGLIGIEIDLLADTSTALIENQVAAGTVDLALLTLPRGISDTVSAASAFGCPASDLLGIGSTVTPTPTSSPASSPPESTPTESRPTESTPAESRPAESTTSQAPTQTPSEATAAPRTGNLSGYCDPQTQLQLVAAISGTADVRDADPKLWAELPVQPVIQPMSVFAVSESLRGVLDGPHQGWMWTGPLSGLAEWPMS